MHKKSKKRHHSSSRSERRYRSTKRKLRRITSKLDTLTQLFLKQSQTTQTQTTIPTQKETPMKQSINNLKEITTPRQAKNGTRMFQCPQTGDLYGSYASGYTRRKSASAESQRFYQLNPVDVTKQNIKLNNGFEYVYHSTKRIMIPNESDRLALIEQRYNSRKA